LLPPPAGWRCWWCCWWCCCCCCCQTVRQSLLAAQQTGDLLHPWWLLLHPAWRGACTPVAHKGGQGVMYAHA
jgi:hypothetical protein